MAGRCYLVAPEHVRVLAPDEIATLKLLIRHGLEQLQQASKADDFIDISRDQVEPTELESALAHPAGNDMEIDTMSAAIQEPESAGIVDPSASSNSVPIVELEPEPSIPIPMAEDVQLHETLDQHVGESVTPPVADLEKRKADEAFEPEDADTASGADRSVVTWQPEGGTDQLRWKRT